MEYKVDAFMLGSLMISENVCYLLMILYVWMVNLLFVAIVVYTFALFRLMEFYSETIDICSFWERRFSQEA